MTLMILLYGIAAAFMLGFGIIIALRVTKTFRDNSRLLKAQRLALNGSVGAGSEGFTAKDFGLNIPRRSTNCLALPPHGAVRHVKGGYMRGYHVELSASLHSADYVVEDLYDRLGTLLATEKPAGTIIQYRFANHPDPGYAVFEHQQAMGEFDETYQPSRILHQEEINFYNELAANKNFRHFKLSVWIYVPSKHGNDNMNNGLAAFFRRLKKEGLKGGIASIKLAYESSNDGIMRRFSTEERECYEQAERVFRQIESASPLQMTRMSREETWHALYMGHNENALIAPQLPSSPIAEISDLLLNENIEGNNTWYVMHGERPVTIISLFAPPDKGGSAGIVRGLTNNPMLTGRHTVVAEYIHLSKPKADKNIKSRKRKIEKTSNRPGGGKKFTKENERAYLELDRVEGELTSAGTALTQLRFYVLVYGAPARTVSERDKSLAQLELDCEGIITAVRQSMPGADAAREDAAALFAMYNSTLIGEMDAERKTGRELEEVTSSLAALVPAEAPWRGHDNAHTFFSTVGSRIIGINFFQNRQTTSPLVTVISNTGGGKSVFLARCANDVLATLPHARVRVVDFGESLGPLVEIVGGRHLRFITGEVRTINIWDFKGIEEGLMPDDEQINLVVEDALKLSRTNPDSDTGKLRESVLKKCVLDVYTDELPHNRPGYPRHEPTHSHLLNKLKNYPFSDTIKPHAEQLAALLEEYRGHPWLDAPTHVSYHEDSPLDVYELDSLDKFPKDVRESLAFRVGARVIRSIGEKIDGELTPTLLIFDEMKKIKDTYPDIMKAIKKGARQGRKENVVTMLGTQAYEDLEPIRDITANAGCTIIGKQIGNVEQMIKDLGWSEAAAEAVNGIHNVKGSHAQYVISFGSGTDQQVEMIQVELSPVSLWTFTSDPIERNARARVARLRPDWTTADIVYFLASQPEYRRGLVFYNLTHIDESLVPPMPLNSMALMLPAYAGTEEPGGDAVHQADFVEGLTEDEITSALSSAFEQDDNINQRRDLAQRLGVDVPGAIVADEDLNAIEAEVVDVT